MMMGFKRFGIVGCLIRMSMRDDGAIGQDVAVQENNLVDDQQPRQGYNQTGKYFFYLIMSGEIHHTTKVSRFGFPAIPIIGDIYFFST